MVPSGVLELDVAGQQLTAEGLSERDVGGVVRVNGKGAVDDVG